MDKKRKISYSELAEQAAYSISNVYLFILLSVIFAPFILFYWIYVLIIQIKKYNKLKYELDDIIQKEL